MTYAKSSSSTVTFPTATGRAGKYYRTYFRYARYDYYYCDGVACGWVASRVKPYKWDRGAQVIGHVPQPEIQSRNCSRYARGSKDYSRGSKAVTWSNGVLVKGDLLGEIGSLSMSSQTGFTSEAENYVHFTRRGRLCGWAGPLGDNPGILAARRW